MFSKHFKLLSFKLCMSKELIEEYPKNFMGTIGTKYSTSIGNLIEAELWDNEADGVLKQYIDVDVEQYEIEILTNENVRVPRQLVLSTLKSPSNLGSIISTLKEMNSREYYLEISFMDDHEFGICEHTFTMGVYLQDTEAHIETYIEPMLLTFTNIDSKYMLAANMFKSNTCINLCDVSDHNLKGIEVPIGEATKVTSIIFDDGVSNIPSYQLDVSTSPMTKFLWREACNSPYGAKMFEEVDFVFSKLRPLNPSIPELPTGHRARLNIHGTLERESGEINVTTTLCNVSYGAPTIRPIGYTLECYLNTSSEED